MINWPVYEQLELHLVMMDVLAVGLQRDEQCGRGSPPLLWFVFSSRLWTSPSDWSQITEELGGLGRPRLSHITSAHENQLVLSCSWETGGSGWCRRRSAQVLLLFLPLPYPGPPGPPLLPSPPPPPACARCPIDLVAGSFVSGLLPGGQGSQVGGQPCCGAAEALCPARLFPGMS